MKIKLQYKIIALAIVAVSALLSFNSPSDRYFDIAKNMEIFTSVYSEVNRYYVDDVDPNKMMKKGIDAMLESLDPYTNYIPEDKIEDFRFISTGQYGGIGAVIGNRDEKIMILMPYENFPANKAGLKIGDEVVEINGVNVTGKSTSDISDLLKGQAETQVDIKIKRFGTPDLIPIEIIREKITVKSVPYYGMLSKDVGYFKLSSFTSDATKDITEALKGLQEKGATKFVFDLRGNTGGLLNEAITIANLFIEKGKEVVSTRGKVEKWNATHNTQTNPTIPTQELVILINDHSASASEIVSGVIQDYDRGILIGRQTFGKGLVQATMETAFNSQIKVTTAKYYIPSGRCIQAIDYSNKDKNGKATKIPDSLLVAFKTANGRTVYDGAGIAPDVIIELPDASDVLAALVTKNVLFDYATEYYYSHEKIAPAAEFKLTDAEYASFVKWVSDKNIDYKITTEKYLEDFAKELKEDTLLAVDFSEEITRMKNKLATKKKEALTTFKSEISSYLEGEIVSRYYLETGIIEHGFKSDPDIKKALEILSNSSEYKKILAKK